MKKNPDSQFHLPVIYPRNGRFPFPSAAHGASSSSTGGCASTAGCHSSTKWAVSTFFRRARSFLLIDWRMRKRSRLSLVHETGRLYLLPPRTELPPHRLADAQAHQAITHPRNGPSLPSPTARGASSSSIGECADASGSHSSTKRAVSTFFHRARSFLLIDLRMRSRIRLLFIHETGRLHFLQPRTELPPHRLADAQAQQAVTRLRNGPSPLSPTAHGACPSSTCGYADASGSPCRTTVPESRAIPP